MIFIGLCFGLKQLVNKEVDENSKPDYNLNTKFPRKEDIMEEKSHAKMTGTKAIHEDIFNLDNPKAFTLK